MKQDKDKLMRSNIRFINALQTSNFFWSKVMFRLGHHKSRRYLIFFKKNINGYYESLRSHLELVYDRLRGAHSEESTWELWSLHLKLKIATRIYSGLRFRFGLPSRGQRTRSNSKTIGFFCRVKVRKNVNYSAQKKKRSELSFGGASKSKTKDVTFSSGKKYSEQISFSQLYDQVYSDKATFFGSVISVRNALAQNKGGPLSKDVFRSFKEKSSDHLKIFKKRKKFHTRFWWLRKQKAKAWKKTNNRQKAYHRYVAKRARSLSMNRQRSQSLGGDGLRKEQPKLISFDQFLMPADKKKLIIHQQEVQRCSTLSQFLQDVKIKWVYFNLMRGLFVMQDRVNSNQTCRHFNLYPCTKLFEEPWKSVSWNSASRVSLLLEQGKEKKEYIQKEKSRLTTRRTDPQGFSTSKASKSIKRSDQLRQKTLDLKLRKQQQFTQRVAQKKRRQGFSM